MQTYLATEVEDCFFGVAPRLSLLKRQHVYMSHNVSLFLHVDKKNIKVHILNVCSASKPDPASHRQQVYCDSLSAIDDA